MVSYEISLLRMDTSGWKWHRQPPIQFAMFVESFSYLAVHNALEVIVLNDLVTAVCFRLVHRRPSRYDISLDRPCPRDCAS